MIVVDTSALMAIVLNEPAADACIAALEAEDNVLISAGTLAEVLIVAARRNVASLVSKLINGMGLEIIPASAASARRIADIYGKWGTGRNAAGLNFGDCFAHELAKPNRCRLLYVGGDFAKTDIPGVL